jgi:hypothetical protein
MMILAASLGSRSLLAMAARPQRSVEEWVVGPLERT